MSDTLSMTIVSITYRFLFFFLEFSVKKDTPKVVVQPDHLDQPSRDTEQISTSEAPSISEEEFDLDDQSFSAVMMRSPLHSVGLSLQEVMPEFEEFSTESEIEIRVSTEDVSKEKPEEEVSEEMSMEIIDGVEVMIPLKKKKPEKKPSMTEEEAAFELKPRRESQDVAAGFRIPRPGEDKEAKVTLETPSEKPEKEVPTEAAPKEFKEMQFKIPVPEDKAAPVTDEVVLAVTVAPEEEQPTEAAPDKPVEKPTFIKPLKPQEIVAHSESMLTCQVIGNPMPTVSWFLDEAEIRPDDERYRMEQQPNGVCTLTIRDVLAEDEGDYTVKAINTVGSDTTEAEMT